MLTIYFPNTTYIELPELINKSVDIEVRNEDIHGRIYTNIKRVRPASRSFSPTNPTNKPGLKGSEFGQPEENDDLLIFDNMFDDEIDD